MKKAVFMAAGLLLTGIGIVGIFLPVIPTTAPLLLAAWCFGRSSRRYHAWLVGHPVLGRYIASFLASGAITIRGKVYSIGAMTLMITLSAVFFTTSTVVRLILAAAAVAGTIWILSYPTLKEPHSRKAD